jgi:type VI secretion system Hcp family effector
MANHGSMTITGKAQGLISAGCSTLNFIGNQCQTEHADEIMVLSYSHNMASVRNINKPTHHAIFITKNVDKSSPLLAQALSSKEEINCAISFYRVSSFGLQEKLYSISINGGVVADPTLENAPRYFAERRRTARTCCHPLPRHHVDPPLCWHQRI